MKAHNSYPISIQVAYIMGCMVYEYHIEYGGMHTCICDVLGFSGCTVYLCVDVTCIGMFTLACMC